jgi:hypothetical protein
MADTVSNVDQLRERIDSGHTAEKIGFPDPATAPLGTDAEAGGAPPTKGEVALDHQAAAAAAPVRSRRPHSSGVVIYIAMAVLFGIVLLGILASI